MKRHVIALGASLLVLGLAACTDGARLRAAQVQTQDELIGGPSARGKVGDFLLENDRIRAVVGGPGPGFAAGTFGGTLLDVDLRRWEAEFRDKRGFDAFSESFPLANLLIVNPADPKQVLKLTPAGFQADPKCADDTFPDGQKPPDCNGFKLESQTGSVAVLKDGSDGQEATVRVEGRSAYLFDVLKFLNRDFLEGLLSPITFSGMELDMCLLADLLPALVEEPDLSLFGLLNRLQIAFEFTTDYTLRPGESFVRMTTTIAAAPGTERLLGGCPPVPCELDCGDAGYAMEEVDVDPVKYGGCAAASSMPFQRMCPVCACAKATAEMPLMTESKDIFKVLLGDLASWTDASWKGGVVAGDFLFYGSDCEPFAPGPGHDIERKVYENMWQGVGTLGSPMTFDYLAAVGENVSYAWTTRNEAAKHVDASGNEIYWKDGVDCPSYRLAITRLMKPEAEATVSAYLKTALGLAQRDADARARQVAVDRRPQVLAEFPMGATDLAPGADQAAKDLAFRNWTAQVLAGPEAQAARQALGDGAELALLAAPACLPSKVLVPLFSSSATAVLTHFTEGDRLTRQGGGAFRDEQRQFRYSRFLVVGQGDVGSALRDVFTLRGTPHGEVRGAVLEEGSLSPITHADVFLLKDPRPVDAQGRSVGDVPADFAAYRKLAREAFGHTGVWSQMQTDVGNDDNIDGAFSGAAEPGRYLVVARTATRGLSKMAGIEVRAGGTEVVNLALPPPGRIQYRIVDESGQRGPGRLSFLRLDALGQRDEWEAGNEPELGDPRYDHGVTHLVHSPDGEGIVELPPARYDVIASRGLEYGIDRATVQVVPGALTTLQVRLPREVDTTGYVSTDFHVHAQASSDAGLPNPVRVHSALAEGVEHFAQTDHDAVVDLRPYINAEGLGAFLSVEPGVEASPLEYGHYNAYPVRYDDTTGDIHDAPAWQGKTLRGIFDEMRSRAGAAPDEFVVQVNHPRDGVMGYLNQLGVKGYSLQRKTPGMMMCSQVLEEAPCDFDVMEVLNGKNTQYIHTPTIGEMEHHNRCYRELVKANTLEALKGTCGWLRADPAPDCAAAIAADLSTVPEAGLADAVLKRDHCLWNRELDAAFEAECTLELASCKRLVLEALKLFSVRWMMERTPLENDTYYATRADTDPDCVALDNCDVGCSGEEACKACLTPLRPECFQKNAQGGSGFDASCVVSCRQLCPAADARPCTDKMQPLEDWFKLMDRGFYKPGMATSDSHHLLNEVGMARTYVESPTDNPGNIDPRTLHLNVKAGRSMPTAGPFVTLSIADAAGGQVAGHGGTLDASSGGDLVARLVVQTPSWFAVDRIEIYRNSKLERRLFPTARPESVVDFDQEITLPRPAEDSWYVVVAYGTGADSVMSPVYKRRPYGDILISTIIALGLDQILANMGALIEKLQGIISLDSLLGSLEMPDSFPILPIGMTNPVFVDLDGKGFTPREAVQAKGAGGQPAVGADGLPVWAPPPFCSVACDPADPAACPENQQCVKSETTGQPRCIAPTPAHCVGLQSVGLRH